jgi:hypothetical protein
MKTRINSFIIGLVIFTMTSIAGISKENKIDLKTPEIQQQVFSQILNDKDLMQNFVVQLQKNEDAMDVMMSSIMMKCCTDSTMYKNLSKKISDHDQILEQLGKVLLEKDDSNYTKMPRPRYKHK